MKRITIDQLQKKMNAFDHARTASISSEGWVRSVRSAIGMTLEQLGKKLSLSRQSVKAIEKREQDGSITINALRDAAKALDMELVYGFVPLDGTLEKYIARKAELLALKIVHRTSHSMMLENQENSNKRLAKAITERKKEIIREMPKALWD